MTSPANTDTVIIRDLRANATVGRDRWGKIRAQPVTISVHVETSLAAAGASDDVADSIHYGDLCKDVLRLAEAGGPHDDLRALVDAVARLALSQERAQGVRVVAEALNQFLMAASLGVCVERARDAAAAAGASAERVFIRDLRLAAVIGVNPPERRTKQTVVTNVVFHSPTWSRPDWNAIVADLTTVIEESSFLTLEAFATDVARSACAVDGATLVTVRAEKPNALVHAHSSGVEITRSREFFASTAKVTSH